MMTVQNLIATLDIVVTFWRSVKYVKNFRIHRELVAIHAWHEQIKKNIEV